MKARILSIALSALISAACLSPAADRLSAEAVSKWELEGGYTEYSDHNDGEYGLDYYIYPDHAVLVQATWDWSGITIPETVNGVPVTAIADEAFMGQTSSYIEIPSTVTDLGNSLSALATTLTLEVDPGNKSYINTGDAVYTSDMKELIRCSSFYEGKEFIIPDTVEKIDSKAFYGIESIEKINIPASVSEIGDSAFSGCKNLQSIEVDGDNKYYSSGDGVLFNKCMDILYLYPCANSNTSYTIPDSVKEIYDEAFSFCNNLETVSFGSSVEVIGYSAFSACDKLNNIVLPDSLEEIKEFAFLNCPSLSQITFSGSIEKMGREAMRNTPWLDEQPDGIIYAGSVLYMVKGKLPENSAVKVKEGTLSICNSAFCTESDENGADTGDKNLVSVTLPNGIRNIGSYAFCGCSNLKEINLPDSIRYLGYSTFEGCSSLENVHIPTLLDYINDSVFASCSSLKEVVIPQNIDFVHGGAFANCTSLKSLTVEGEYCYLDDPFGMQENHSDSGNTDFSGTIYGPGQSAVEGFAARHGYNFAVLDSTGTTPVKTASDGIWSWDEYSDHAEICGYQDDSEVLDIPAELNGLPVTAISPSFCMESPGHITGLKIPAGLTDIGNLPFYLERLKDAEIDENNKSFVLENGALYTADKSVLIKCLTDKVKGEFIVPAPVNIISNHAFANCTELTAIGLNASVTSFPNDLQNCPSLEAVNVSKRNERYVSRDGVLFDNFVNELVIYPRNREGNSYSVPNGTEEIRDMAFYDCDKLENIELPETLDTISYNAFRNCDKLDNIVIPAKVSTIDDRAFKNCKSLENITFSDNITYFGTDVMTGTPWLEAQPDGPVYCGSALYTIKGDTAEVTVKDGTKCIADHCFVSAETDENGVAFLNTNKTLKTVSLPDSIQRFGYMTFVNCEALTTVNIPKNLKKSAYCTFSGCSSLKNIILSDADREIGDNEYECCDSLTDVVIPENISSIGSGAFAGCASLSSVTIKNPDCEICLSPETISNNVQYGDNSEVTAAFSGTIYGYDGSTAEKYAKEYGYKFTSLGKTLPKGDVNNDGRINAVDASSVLYYYAMTSTSRDGGFTDVQKLAAEVNRDGTINAVDASCILAYYAYTSTTEFELVSLDSFISRMN